MRLPVKVRVGEWDDVAPALLFVCFGVAVGCHFDSWSAGFVAWLGALVYRDVVR